MLILFRNYKYLIIPCCVCLFIYGLAYISTDYVANHVNRISYERYLKGEKRFTPWPNGLPWEIYTVYKTTASLSESPTMVIMGPSAAREGIEPNLLDLPNGWDYKNFASGGESIDSFELLWNYLNEYASRRLDKRDLLVLQICHPDFIERPIAEDELKSYLEMFGFYQVDDRLQVHGQVRPWIKEWALFNYKIRWITAYIFKVPNLNAGPNFPFLKQLIEEYKSRWFFSSPIEQPSTANVPQKINDLPNKELLEQYSSYWKNYMKNSKIPGKSTEQFKELVGKISKQTNLVIVNLYAASWFSLYPVEKDYRAWIQSDLQPFLKIIEVPFLNMQDSVSDIFFDDSSHIFYQGRVQFTKDLNSRIKAIDMQTKR